MGVYASNDTTWLEMKKNSFAVRFRRQLDPNGTVSFAAKRREAADFIAAPLKLGYYDHRIKKFVALENAVPSKGNIENNRVIYQNVFTGMDLEYMTTFSGVKENYILSQTGRDGLPAPGEVGMNEETTSLAIENIIRFNDNIEAFAGGRSVTENDPVKGRKFEYKGNKGVLFRSVNGKGRFALPAGYAWLAPDQRSADSSDVSYTTQLERVLSHSDDGHKLYTCVPYTWIKNAKAGTIIIDPTVVIAPDTLGGEDTFIYYNDGSNYGGSPQMQIGNNNRRKGLIRFDLTGVPFGAKIDSAALELYHYLTTYTGDFTLNAYRMLRDWAEGDTTGWGNNSPHGCDWYYADDDSNFFWNSNGPGSGTDYHSTSLDSAEIEDTVYNVWKSWDVQDAVELWVENPDTNFGLALIADPSDFSVGAMGRFRTSDYTVDPSLRPRLSVTFTVNALVKIHYDAMGRPDSLAIEKDGGCVYELNEYDADRGWLVRREYKKDGDNLFNIYNKEYDDVGNLEKQLYTYGNLSADSMEYSYDDYYRLAGFKQNGVQERSYYYDDNGNRKSPVSGYPRFAYENDNNQLTEFQYQDGGQTKTIDYQFDVTGRCTQSRESSTVMTYNYDVFNNLRTYTIPYELMDYYRYDDHGFRTKKNSNSSDTYYFRSGGQVLSEYDENNDIEYEYIYALGRKLVKFDPGVGYLYFYSDHLGSTRVLDGPDSYGADMQRDYYPYGEFYTKAGSDQTPYQYTGQEYDDGTGLHYFGARYYPAQIGRWLTPDPAGQGWGPYSYCGGNPVNMIDPDGRLFGIDDLLIAGILIGGYAGGAIANDHGNPMKWDYESSETWQGIGIGAATGLFLASGLTVGGAYGVSVGGAASNTLSGWYFDEVRGWDLLKYAAVGFGTSYLGATGGFGLAGSKGTPKGWKVARRLATQMLTTLSRSIGNNWAAGRNPVGSFTVGVGPLTFRTGTDHPLQLNMRDNVFSAVSNGIGLFTTFSSWIDTRFSGENLDFHWESLSPIYYNDLLPNRAMGPYSIWNPYAAVLAEEGNHVWQSRLFNELFLLVYGWDKLSNIINGGSYYDQHLENQAGNKW